MSQGWHPDPFGRYAQRYHDGTGWTANVSNREGVTEQDPQGATGIPMAPPVTEVPVEGRVEGFAAVPGSPWARLGARILDGLIVGIPSVLLALGVFGVDLDLEAETFEVPVSVLLLVAVVSFLYDTLMVGTWGRTVGKMAVGLTVVRRGDARLPDYGVAALRGAAYAVLYSIPYLGFIAVVVMAVMIFTDRLRQTPHDKLAATVVVTSGSVPVH